MSATPSDHLERDLASAIAGGLCSIVGARAGFLMSHGRDGWSVVATTPHEARLSDAALGRLATALHDEAVQVLPDLARSDAGGEGMEHALAIRVSSVPPLTLVALGVEEADHPRGIAAIQTLADLVGIVMRGRGADRSAIERSRAASLVAAGMVLSANLDLDRVLEALVDSAREVLGARYAALGVRDGAEHRLSAFVTSGIDPEVRARIGDEPHGAGLLGLLFTDSGPIRIDHIADDPRAAGFPPGHPVMRSFLGVPVRVGSEVFGNLYVTDKHDGPFTEEDEFVAVTLAAQAAVAIANANRFGEKERAVVTEAKAKERAAEDGLRRAIEAQETERARIARELHDQAGQDLTALAVRLRALEEHVQGDVGRERLLEVRQSLTRISSALRELALELRPSGLREHGLASAIERQAERMADASGITIAVALDALPSNLSEPAEIALFRAIQEALTNVVRHSEARNASVSASFRDHLLRIVVEDDGCGFNTAAKTERLGLVGIRERMELIGGHFRIESAPRSGAIVILELEVPNG